MNCPICNKAGLENPTNICPQCNSDLSAFHLLKNLKISKGSNKTVNYRNIIGLFAITVAFILIYFLFPKEKIKEVIVNNTVNIDSIKATITDSLKLISKDEPEGKTIKYIVKAGDNLTTIAKATFNDERYIKQLVKDNKIVNPNYLKEGQVLFIDLSTKK